MGDAPRFRIRLADGTAVEGVVQGAGGPCSDVGRLEALLRRRDAGRVGRFERLTVYPDYSAAANGSPVSLPVGDIEGVEVL